MITALWQSALEDWVRESLVAFWTLAFWGVVAVVIAGVLAAFFSGDSYDDR